MRGAQIRPSHVFTFFTHTGPFEGLDVLRTYLASRSTTFGLHKPPQVFVTKLVPLCGRSPPSLPKVASLATGTLVDTTEPSGLYVIPYRSPAGRLGDVF